MKVALIRHGKTLGNQKHVYLGRTDEGLSECGVLEINYYLQNGIYPCCDKIYTSPMKRCIETKDIIYNKKSKIINEFREMDFGLFEYKTYDEIIKDKRYSDFGKDENSIYFPNGEDVKDFKQRCQKAFYNIISNKNDCVIICHGGTIMSILEKYGIPKNSFYHWNCKNGLGFIVEIENNIITKVERLKI